MTLEKLKLQNIETLIIDKKKDENTGMISLFGELVEVRFERGTFKFWKNITEVKEIDMNLITKLNKCLNLANGGLQTIHSRLVIKEDRLFSVIEIDNDQIVNVKSHERLANFVFEALCYKEVFTSHSV